jgi:hypothetical protein
MGAYIAIELQRQIRNQFVNCCAYCHTAEALTPTTFEFDHIEPRSAGGETTLVNLCLSCPSCNRYKSQRQQASDPDTKEIVSLFNPQFQEWIDHFVWNEDFTEIIALTSIGRATITTLKMNRPQMIRVRRMWVKVQEHPPK